MKLEVDIAEYLNDESIMLISELFDRQIESSAGKSQHKHY